MEEKNQNKKKNEDLEKIYGSIDLINKKIENLNSDNRSQIILGDLSIFSSQNLNECFATAQRVFSDKNFSDYLKQNYLTKIKRDSPSFVN